jgi:hypothetical protein
MADPIVPSPKRTNKYARKSRGPYKRNKLIYGVGVVDAPYVVRNRRERTTCPFYQVWRSMLTRCYCPKFHKNHPTYAGCKVADTWHSFMSFKLWMETKNWQGMELDKDLLSDDRIYGPDNCVFVPGWLNVLFGSHRKATGLPVGVTITQCGRYRSRISVQGERQELGVFATPQQAYCSYANAKITYVRSRYPEIQQIDPRLIDACERRLAQLTSSQ